MNSRATCTCSRDPRSRRARLRVAGGPAASGLAERAQRPGDRAGQDPGDAETEDQRQHADADQGEDVLANLILDRAQALLDLQRAHRAAVADDRHRGGEDVAALVVAALRDLAAECLQRHRVVGRLGRAA